MEVKPYFFDTYAFFELIEGNKNYEKFSDNVVIVTTKLNLMELYYGLLTRFGIKSANFQYDELVKYAIELDDETIKEAMLFRMLNKPKEFSYIDCLGYTLAKKMNIRFLTGDEEFKDMENVEFVK